MHGPVRQGRQQTKHKTNLVWTVKLIVMITHYGEKWSFGDALTWSAVWLKEKHTGEDNSKREQLFQGKNALVRMAAVNHVNVIPQNL